MDPSTHTPESPSRRVVYVLAGLILLAYGWHCWAVDYVVDDSFITFRYVANFVNGHGIVYNPGERVEGYTNFLWLLLLSGVALLRPSVDLLLAAQVLGVACGLATIVLAMIFSWHLHQRVSIFGLVAGALLALNSAFCAWSTGGLETTLFALLVFAASCAYVLAIERGAAPVTAPLLFGLAALTRPEGALLFAAVSAHLLWIEVRSGGSVFGRRVALWGLLFSSVFIPYYAWRLTYYGYAFPNTFYAKVGSGLQQYRRGVRYLLDYVLWNGAFVFALPLFALLKRHRPVAVAVFAVEAAVYLTYIVYVGGDGLAHFRFVACIAPFVCFLVQEGFLALYGLTASRIDATGWRLIALRTGATLVMALSLGFAARMTLGVVFYPAWQRWYEPQSELSFPGDGSDHQYLWFDNYFVDRLATAARWLQQNAPQDAVVASTPAGSIGYHMSLNVIDMLGLNDLHIAHGSREVLGGGRAGHEKGDGRYVLSRSPDYILLGNVAVLPRPLTDADFPQKLVQRSEREIWSEPDFHARYERVTVQLSDTGVFRYFTFYRKKDLGRQPSAEDYDSTATRRGQRTDRLPD